MSATPEIFQYDLDGNLTNDGRWSYRWDGENRLTNMVANTTKGPQLNIRFEYDWQGRRIAKKVWSNIAASGNPILDEKYVYDGWNLIAILNPDLSPRTSFMWGTDLSGSMQGAGGVGGLLAVYDRANGVHFTTFDGNGNVSALVSAATGEPSAQYEYGPFGEVIRATGPMSKSNPFRFSTKYQDDETDLLYYGYRYYSPSTGRWLSRDPIGEISFFENYSAKIERHTKVLLSKAALKPAYVFLGNRPVDSVDAFGLFSIFPKNTGVRLCKEKGDIHHWIEYPGGTVGFWPPPSGDWYPGGVGQIIDPDPTGKDPNTERTCLPVYLDCFYNIPKFVECIKSAKDLEPPWYSVVGFGADNCGTWALKVIIDCKRKAFKFF